MKDFIVHIEWEGNGKREERPLTAENITEARKLAKLLIYNPSPNYGYSYYVTEKPTNNQKTK